MRIRVLSSWFLTTLMATIALPSYAEETFSSNVDVGGGISLPEDFRVTMAHLGSWFVPSGGASGFHDVYTERETVSFFRKHGKFPDGATLVKELRVSTSGDYTTGPGVHHATSAVKQWFVMVKDSEGRFADNTVWGDGWGWALFKADSGNVNIASDYKTDCLACHVPAKNTDWVYTTAYPTLSQ